MATPTHAAVKRKPPVHSRFQKGRAGNPGGPPAPARRLLLSLLERDARLVRSGHGVAPSFEEGLKVESPKGDRTAAFSLSEGKSEGKNQQCKSETPKMLDEKAFAPKEQGKIRGIAGAPGGRREPPAGGAGDHPRRLERGASWG